MKKYMLMAAMAIMGLSSCGQTQPQPSEGSRTDFALSFFKAVSSSAKPGENVVASPYSAGVALSMLTEGAAGQTKVELDNALNGCLFMQEPMGDSETVTVKSANSIWISDNFSVRNRFVAHMEDDFKADVEVMDFADPATLQSMNRWCADNTEGKITKIKDSLSPNNVMILANALYFKASWENQFDPKATQEETFHGRNGDTEVKMMYRKGAYEYMEYQGCQMIKLPYLDSGYAMYVVLPPAGMDPETVLPYIGESVYNMAMGMLKPEQVRFSMPKVRLETSMNLNKTLGKMGVKTAFSGAADFKEISVSGPLVLDEVAQNCYIDITESGTEAAAVTSAAISLTSLRPQENVKTMKVDRPYIFFIADSENILFTGKILNL